MLDGMVGVSYGASMHTERLLNLTPITLDHLGRFVARSKGADGNSPEGLVDSLRRALSAGFTHIEAHDVRTGEKWYMPVCTCPDTPGVDWACPSHGF